MEQASYNRLGVTYKGEGLCILSRKLEPKSDQIPLVSDPLSHLEALDTD